MSQQGDPGRSKNWKKSQRQLWTVLFYTVLTSNNVKFGSFCRITGTLELGIDVAP